MGVKLGISHTNGRRLAEGELGAGMTFWLWKEQVTSEWREMRKEERS